MSHCASCDAPLLVDRNVAVVGGGDSALQEALALADHVAQVTVLVRDDALSGQEAYRRAADEHAKIEVRYGVVVEEILGDEKVAGARTRDVATGATADLAVDGVFAYVGLEPNTGFLGHRVELDADGRIPTDADLRTALPGVLAAGLVRRGAAGRAAASAGDGATAAVTARRYLDDGDWAPPDEVAAALRGSDG